MGNVKSGKAWIVPHLCAGLPISFSSLTYSELPEAKKKITTSFGSDLNYFFVDLRWVNNTVYTHGSISFTQWAKYWRMYSSVWTLKEREGSISWRSFIWSYTFEVQCKTESPIYAWKLIKQLRSAKFVVWGYSQIERPPPCWGCKGAEKSVARNIYKILIYNYERISIQP